MVEIYKGCTELTGYLQPSKKLRFRDKITSSDRRTLLLFLVLTISASFLLIGFMITSLFLTQISAVLIVALSLIVIVEIIRLIQSVTLIRFAFSAKDPVPMVPETGLRIAILTTIVPGKEPFDLVERTLKMMKEINPGRGNTADVWLLDEGNDPDIKRACKAIGVKHFSRKGVKKWNQTEGVHKAKTKHGNHNAWRSKNENNYDIVAQMDPDHVPHKDFLMRTLGYFNDNDVAFVVAPQVYGNLKESWIARASAFQAYVFHGVIQPGGNGMNAPLLIGTNHLYRTKAFKEIGGYQDSIIEDHLTSMVIYASKNENGNHWKGVYTPDILAIGEGPTSFTDYFNQQKRWAYGIWEIATKSSPKVLKQMARPQALSFIMLQTFYPSVAVAWVASFLATFIFATSSTALYSIGGVLFVIWGISIITTLWLFLWLRKFNLVEHERKDWGVEGMGLLLMCIPVYVSAAWEALTRKPLTYAVTAKGDLTSPDNMKTFTPHLFWVVLNMLIISASIVASAQIYSAITGWSLFRILVCLLPIAIYLFALFNTDTFARWYFRALIYYGFYGQAQKSKYYGQTVRFAPTTKREKSKPISTEKEVFASMRRVIGRWYVRALIYYGFYGQAQKSKFFEQYIQFTQSNKLSH